MLSLYLATMKHCTLSLQVQKGRSDICTLFGKWSKEKEENTGLIFPFLLFLGTRAYQWQSTTVPAGHSVWLWQQPKASARSLDAPELNQIELHGTSFPLITSQSPSEYLQQGLFAICWCVTAIQNIGENTTDMNNAECISSELCCCCCFFNLLHQSY